MWNLHFSAKKSLHWTEKRVSIGDWRNGIVYISQFDSWHIPHIFVILHSAKLQNFCQLPVEFFHVLSLFRSKSTEKCDEVRDSFLSCRFSEAKIFLRARDSPAADKLSLFQTLLLVSCCRSHMWGRIKVRIMFLAARSWESTPIRHYLHFIKGNSGKRMVYQKTEHFR